eukprot:CFRG1306T1
MTTLSFSSFIGFLLCLLAICLADGAKQDEGSSTSLVLKLDENTFDSTVSNITLVVVLFGTSWCKYSRAFVPIFESTAKQISDGNKEINPTSVSLSLAAVNCDESKVICNEHRVSKYPTVRAFWHGRPLSKEYRGTRNVPSLLNYIKHLLEPHLTEVLGSMEFATLGHHSRVILGVFDSQESENYQIFQQTAEKLFEVCHFHYTASPSITGMKLLAGEPIILFKKIGADVRYAQEYTNGTLNEENFYKWATTQCKPLVDELNFKNAEELTEEGLPFMVLFTSPEDTSNREAFVTTVQNTLSHEKRIKFLVADGTTFSRPLKALGMTEADLPVLAIDSFSHMYLFPENVDRMHDAQTLKSWVEDFFTGRLHKAFHAKNNEAPPKTEFQKLLPSKKRYTLRAKDEL